MAKDQEEEKEKEDYDEEEGASMLTEVKISLSRR